MTDNEKAATFIGWKRISCDEDFHTGNPERWRRCPNCNSAEAFYMTENEKAATFIGWRPGEVCESEMGCPEWDMDQSSVFHRDHLVAAPDMSDPRNYTKALEGLWWERAMNGRWKVLRSGKAHGFGHTPQKALAALYDAERGT